MISTTRIRITIAHLGFGNALGLIVTSKLFRGAGERTLRLNKSDRLVGNREEKENKKMSKKGLFHCWL